MSLSHEDKVKKSKSAAAEEAAPESAAPAADLAELQGALKEKTREAEEHYERLLRLAAEMENLKKRQERERADLLQFANENLIKELLPVVWRSRSTSASGHKWRRWWPKRCGPTTASTCWWALPVLARSTISSTFPRQNGTTFWQ